MESFEYNRELAKAFMIGGEQQKMMFILSNSKSMVDDNLDNLDAGKTHPAMIELPFIREEADKLTKDILIRTVSVLCNMNGFT